MATAAMVHVYVYQYFWKDRDGGMVKICWGDSSRTWLQRDFCDARNKPAYMDFEEARYLQKLVEKR